MPSPYPNMIKEVSKSAVEGSMQAVADELHQEADCTLSAVTDNIDIAVSFGSAESGLTKKVLESRL